MAESNLRAAVKDPQLRQSLTPDYAIGCKRILLSDTYLPALAAPNVKLVTRGLKQVCVALQWYLPQQQHVLDMPSHTETHARVILLALLCIPCQLA